MLIGKHVLILCLIGSSFGCNTFRESQKFSFVNNERFNVPDVVLNKDWKKIDAFEHLLSPSEPFVWRKVVYYGHSKKQWFKSEQEYFGQDVFKAFGIRDDQDNLIGHWFVLKKEGKSFLLESSEVRFEWLENDTNKIVGVEIFFLDKSDNIIISRVVDRN